mmetsp:Transcript_30956/g.74773  ORF Transcript_30956/g.74773 Transcript_30956/m.74773 type:complete len:466 (+) Transcript_30956:113-1510(+)
MVQGVQIDSDGCLVNTNPATGEVISRVRCTTSAEIDEMVSVATTALNKSWKSMSCEDRVSLLRDGLKALANVRDELATSMVSEMGKPIAEAREELDGATSKDEFMDILLDSIRPKKFGTSTVVRNPFGVVAIMSPWNFPVDEILLLALPSLASGNTVIVKPSEVVPETGALVVRTLQSVLPDGVIQLAQGAGDVGAKLVSHPGIALVAMTGSSATGKKILASAAPNLKRVILEMGGKDPMVVFDDADLTKAAKDAVEYSLCNSGQVCCSVERIYVAEPIYDKFQEMTKSVAATYKVGNGLDPENKVGPLVSVMQREQVKSQVDDAVKKGAKLLLQSETPKDVDKDKCSFYPVTVLADVDETMDLLVKETFGPVVSLTKFDGSEDEAVRLANKSEYGLGSSVYSNDLDKAQRVASRIDAGQVGINCWPLEQMDVHCPWVGHKSSGFGYHSGDGVMQFSIPKTIVTG